LFLREKDNTDNGSTVPVTILIMEAPFREILIVTVHCIEE
jgi:hypothetical protein